MKLFVDTGSIKDIESIAALGILDGVTTNPSLLAKEPGDFRQNLKRICEIVQGPVSGEVTATDFSTAAWILYPSRAYVPRKVRTFIDFMKAHVR